MKSLIMTLATLMTAPALAVSMMPERPILACNSVQYADYGYGVQISQLPMNNAYIITVNTMTIAGSRQVRERAKLVTSNSIGGPVRYVSNNYYLEINYTTSPNFNGPTDASMMRPAKLGKRGSQGTVSVGCQAIYTIQ